MSAWETEADQKPRRDPPVATPVLAFQERDRDAHPDRDVYARLEEHLIALVRAP